MRFTTKDKHFIKWLGASKICGENHLLKMFPGTGWNLNGQKTLSCHYSFRHNFGKC